MIAARNKRKRSDVPHIVCSNYWGHEQFPKQKQTHLNLYKYDALSGDVWELCMWESDVGLFYDWVTCPHLNNWIYAVRSTEESMANLSKKLVLNNFIADNQICYEVLNDKTVVINISQMPQDRKPLPYYDFFDNEWHLLCRDYYRINDMVTVPVLVFRPAALSASLVPILNLTLQSMKELHKLAK